MQDKKVLVTGALGRIGNYIIPGLSKKFSLTLLDVQKNNSKYNYIGPIAEADLINPDRTLYQSYFEGMDAVIHLGYKSRRNNALDDFHDEIDNVKMSYNVLRTAYDTEVKRVVVASSNHAADWYEHALLHSRKLEYVDPYDLPLSDNFYGWAKASYEHIGFLFACGFPNFQDESGQENHVAPSQSSRKLEVVNVRIGAPREIDVKRFGGDSSGYKRDLGAYVSSRDLTQLFERSVEAHDINNEHGIPWQIVYGISDNTRAFWSLSNARSILGYKPQDDSEVKFAKDIAKFLTDSNNDSPAGRLNLS